MSLDETPVTDAPVPADPPPPPTRRPVKVMVCLPSGRTWEARTATAVSGMMCYAVLHGIEVGIINLEGSMITKSRNDLVRMALQQNPDFIMFIDTDMVFPPDALCRLLTHDKDIVGATYNKRVPPYETLGRLKGNKPSEEELALGGLREAELLPTGLMLIKASVFDRVPWPWFYETYQWPGENGVESFKNMLRHSYSVSAPEEMLATIEGTPLAEWLNAVHKLEYATTWEFFSEDLQWCRKCLKMGVSLWCDLSLTFASKHLGTTEITCVPQGRQPASSVVVPAVM